MLTITIASEFADAYSYSLTGLVALRLHGSEMNRLTYRTFRPQGPHAGVVPPLRTVFKSQSVSARVLLFLRLQGCPKGASPELT